MTCILVVEDNQDIQQLLMDVLTPEYQVVQAFSGSQALLLARREQIDLMILDLMLPEVSGESVLKNLRQTSTLPVLVLTAIQTKSHIAAVLEAGANDYLTKPFDIDELLARVHVQLRQPRAAEEVLIVDDLQMSKQSHTVLRAGMPIELARKEFELLAVLMAKPKQVFAKEALYERVWHEPYVGAENTLNVHLSHLRAKLNDDAHQYITSVWGIGVRLL